MEKFSTGDHAYGRLKHGRPLKNDYTYSGDTQEVNAGLGFE